MSLHFPLRFQRFCCPKIGMVAALALGASHAAYAAPTQAQSADKFVDSIGVATHMSYLDTPYGNYTNIKSRLQELGVRHVRDGLDSQTSMDRLKSLYTDAGVRLTALAFAGNFQGDITNIQGWIAKAKTMGPALEAIEGPNEPSEPYGGVGPGFSYGGQAFPQGAFAFQRDLYGIVKGDSQLKTLPVIQMAIAGHLAGKDSPTLAATGVGQYADYGNAHIYGPWGRPPGGEVEWSMNLARSITPNKPMQVTETGRDAQVTADSCCSVSEAVQGRYAGRNVAEHFRQGVTRAFIYELIDTTPIGQPDTGFGLLRNDNTVRPSFTVVKNMISLLKNPGVSFNAGSLDFSLSYNTAKPIRSILLQKSNGTFYLVIYNDAQSWNNDTKQQISIANVPVTLSLATAASRIKVYKPFTNGTSAVASAWAKNSIVLSVPDHPMIVEITR